MSTHPISTELTDEDFDRAAHLLGCEANAIRAVARVEAGPLGAFQPVRGTLRPVILFEGHIFHRYAKPWVRAMAWRLPSIIYPSWTKRWYTGTQLGEYNRFSTAFLLDADAAMQSCSWGLFQIMGFNYRACGFGSVGEFVDAMRRSASEHLMAFCMFIEADMRKLNAIRNRDWATFASFYNGPGYAMNQYDRRMAEAYASLQTQAARA